MTPQFYLQALILAPFEYALNHFPRYIWNYFQFDSFQQKIYAPISPISGQLYMPTLLAFLSLGLSFL